VELEWLLRSRASTYASIAIVAGLSTTASVCTNIREILCSVVLYMYNKGRASSGS